MICRHLPTRHVNPLNNLCRSIPLFLLVSALLGAASTVHAQQTNLASASVYAVDYSSFPTVSALVDVFDTRGIFASGLKPTAFTAVEDGQPLPVDSLTEIAVPLQLVVAVNQGQPLDARDSAGISRFQRVAQVLEQWAQTRPSDPPDDYSLVSQAGPVINHASARQFIEGLNAFQPDFRAAVPNLQSLAVALDTVSAQTPRLGMKRAVLFITPHMDDPNVAALVQPLLQRAVDDKIHVFVWFVDADTTFPTTSAAVFNALAIGTGGGMFQFSGLERFPDPETYFAELRRIYTVSFNSHLKAGGAHAVSMQARLPEGQVNSNELKFTLDIQPPNPIPVSPPLQITRQPPADDPFNTKVLLPASQEIDIIIEFPDGHKRALTRTTLYVDGAIAAENTKAPFDKFTWDLSAYALSGEHQMIVEAVDTLGLSKQSMAIPITVTVIQPPRGPAAFLAKYRQPLTVSAIVIAGLALVFTLISGRLRLPSLRAAQAARRADQDPLTQPVQAVAESAGTVTAKRSKPRTKPKKAATEPKSGADAAATFIRINADGQAIAATPIAVLEKEITLGTDAAQCNQVLDDSSIAPLHARLRQLEDGGYLLLDNNSIAGTWINYEPIPREGQRLLHGDMVHFGQLIYRFTLRTPPEISKPTITVQSAEE